jgi:hypothetical protein
MKYLKMLVQNNTECSKNGYQRIIIPMIARILRTVIDCTFLNSSSKT